MPFGVCNGPSFFQHMMQETFGPSFDFGDASAVRDAIQDSMLQEVEAIHEIFLDDLAAGTTDVCHGTHWTLDAESDELFERHLKKLAVLVELGEVVHARHFAHHFRAAAPAAVVESAGATTSGASPRPPCACRRDPRKGTPVGQIHCY